VGATESSAKSVSYGSKQSRESPAVALQTAIDSMSRLSIQGFSWVDSGLVVDARGRLALRGERRRFLVDVGRRLVDDYGP
jgi:hypothetical protein